MKPAMSPYAVPTITEITVASSAIVSERRVPYSTRLNTSRPT